MTKSILGDSARDFIQTCLSLFPFQRVRYSGVALSERDHRTCDRASIIILPRIDAQVKLVPGMAPHPAAEMHPPRRTHSSIMSLLTVSHLSKSFGPDDVFKGVGFSIPHGARIAIVGPNGIGKTTLLRILVGLEEPSTGVVGRARLDDGICPRSQPEGSTACGRMPRGVRCAARTRRRATLE
jgi:ABC-type glutathione transport system ATPase component